MPGDKRRETKSGMRPLASAAFTRNVLLNQEWYSDLHLRQRRQQPVRETRAVKKEARKRPTKAGNSVLSLWEPPGRPPWTAALLVSLFAWLPEIRLGGGGAPRPADLHACPGEGASVGPRCLGRLSAAPSESGPVRRAELGRVVSEKRPEMDELWKQRLARQAGSRDVAIVAFEDCMIV